LPNTFPTILNAPLTLPCGIRIPTRIVKSALSEGLADSNNEATHKHVSLYGTWAKGGSSLLITGNVFIDRKQIERAGAVAIDAKLTTRGMGSLKRWAASANNEDVQIWMQLSHSGHQTPKAINPTPKAASAIQVKLPGNLFGRSIALTDSEILELIAQFGRAAGIARDAGFNGVQIHAAHGYLISGFLSPRTNRRTDEWGGDLGGRSRFLIEIVKNIRSYVGGDYPIAVKLNSADFQRGGFDLEDSKMVAGWLDAMGVDLIEISGGTYEQPKMSNIEGLEVPHDPLPNQSTREREAYFARFIPEIRPHVSRAKIMVTGGFRTVQGMTDALSNDGIDLIGLGRPLCVEPDLAGRLLKGEVLSVSRLEDQLRIGPGLLGPKSPVSLIKAINRFAATPWYYEQLVLLGDEKKANPKMNFLMAFLRSSLREARAVKQLSRQG
jgi:2,4-dienoyl-CoA reductase-like NADH-dependent reductase (Old Yellow Enzyme family)